MNRKDFKQYRSTAVTDPRFSDPVFDVNRMKENRCPHCNRLLFKGDFEGVIEIKCPMKDCREIISIKQL